MNGDSVEAVTQAFTYHAPRPDQIPKYNSIRDKAKELALTILDLAPASPDRTAAIRKLRECVMTVNAAIAINT